MRDPRMREELQGRRHEIEIVEMVVGGMNAVRLDDDAGRIHGAACRREDVSAAGISGGPARVGGGSIYSV